jgi:TBC1 domain family protein 5
LPDLATSLVRTASASDIAATVGSDIRPPEERPPWEPRPRLEIEKEVTELRRLHKKLGESVGWAVDVLLQSEGNNEERRRQAIESLAYVRDVLAQGSAIEVEEYRLFGEEEYGRRRQREKEERDRKAAAVLAPAEITPPRPPQAATLPASVDPQRPRTQLSTRDSRPASTLTRTPYTAQPQLPRLSSYPAGGVSQPIASLGSLSAPQDSSFSSHTPSSSSVPPWAHTPSNFSAQREDSALPRLPPPLNLYARPSRLPPANSSTVTSPPQSAGYPPGSRNSTVLDDPLGAIR